MLPLCGCGYWNGLYVKGVQKFTCAINECGEKIVDKETSFPLYPSLRFGSPGIWAAFGIDTGAIETLIEHFLGLRDFRLRGGSAVLLTAITGTVGMGGLTTGIKPKIVARSKSKPFDLAAIVG
uniref:Uncharacterized protein n=1 Tax=Glossina brevipalpis TaxID=37001 RepID=A0A1A9WB11_9MUSC